MLGHCCGRWLNKLQLHFAVAVVRYDRDGCGEFRRLDTAGALRSGLNKQSHVSLPSSHHLSVLVKPGRSVISKFVSASGAKELDGQHGNCR